MTDSPAPTAIDVIGFGNALVDVLAHAPDAFLDEEGLSKGSMALIDTARAEHLYGRMGPGLEMSGGSAANTMVGIALLGGQAAFVGRVAPDQLGEVFAHDLRSSGVHSAVAAVDGPPSGRCLILVTPDAQRTLNTFLGAAAEFGPEDVDADLVASAQVTYLEGYLWDQPRAKEAFRHAATVAHEAGRRVALTLSDSFCVDRHRADFLDLVEHHVDLLFANEAEICALYEVDNCDAALQRVVHHCEVAALTRSEKGSVIVAGDEVHVIDAAPAPSVVDTTGAGDLYAAGFLYGFTHGYDLATAGRIGAIAAAEVIGHMGARPEADLRALAATLLGS